MKTKKRHLEWKDGESKYSISYDLTPEKQEATRLTDQEALGIKIRKILEQWYTEMGNSSIWVLYNSNISAVSGGYKVDISLATGGIDTLFVSDVLVRQTEIQPNGAVNTGLTDSNYPDVRKWSDYIRRWDLVVSKWNEGKMIPGPIATGITYRRFVEVDTLPIKVLR